jgi:hypothetical protein
VLCPWNTCQMSAMVLIHQFQQDHQEALVAAAMPKQLKAHVRGGGAVQGNCSTTPTAKELGLSGKPLLHLKPKQCVITTDSRVIIAADSLWLDGLYIRLKRHQERAPISFITAESTMWMTHTTIQGDGLNGTTGSALIASFGTFHAECTILPTGSAS